MQNYLFPNVTFVAATRHRIRLKLFESLHHLIYDVLATKFSPPVSEQELKGMILGGSNFPKPAIFALHGSLLNAAINAHTSDVPELFRILKDQRLRDTEETGTINVTPLSSNSMHQDEVFLLKSAFADDIGLTTSLMAPPSPEVERATALVSEAINALDLGARPWMEELLLLANQVYFAVAESEGELLFGGAAVFDAFGAVLMNPLAFRDPATVLMALIHESSHQQMFLFHLDDPVLLNDASATFSSPLRAQPRPMEGIFHALWVSARMVLAAETVLKSPSRPTWAQDLLEHQARALEAFRDCEQTVAEHGELSDFGLELFENARETIHAI
ncbi:hypothetical protein EBB79_11475 [Parasedimentitalea marina]|uniref:HEXXH motif domain-containing protein n=1 Tax=Parasedimentitalea marina TaxID=2483033 RepID=A0A3T0N364_9RHOB|nr:HEXXH motif-containing putative peptide modification protein [Parasedimentitalea marina]AZV78439.1 hypothetical protein EBB79_11475 [Parasedimentitalea marina]